MSDDWQVGDLALCVRGGRFPHSNDLHWAELPEAGKLYRVAAVSMCRFYPGFYALALEIEDGPANRSGSKIWGACRFRKIRPHTPDEEDRETIRLLTGNKEPAQ